MQVGSLGREDPLEEGMATHSSILAWRIPWTKESGRLHIHGVTKSQTPLNACTSLSLGTPHPSRHEESPSAVIFQLDVSAALLCLGVYHFPRG